MSVSDKTKSMMSMIPQWMKMAKDEDSVGAKFLDAFGVEILDIELYLEEIWNNMYIGTANLQNIDFCYKVPLATRNVIDADLEIHINVIANDEMIMCMPKDTLRQFYEEDEACYMIDTVEGYVYIKATEDLMEENIMKPFDAIDISGTMHYEYLIHHVWNVFDEFGMLLNIYRLPGERNEAFKNRILDVFKNPGNSTKQGLINGISRDLGLSKSEVSLGSFNDKDYIYSELIDNEGVPTDKYIKYIEQINSNLGFSWDHMNWGEAYWRSVEENNLGFHYLPHIWDGFSAEWKSHEVQSGIGSDDDLLVFAPEELPSVREFKAYVGVHGTEEQIEEYNPELQFKYKIVAKGKVPNAEYELESYKHTVLASEIIPLHFVVTAMKKFIFKTHITWNNDYGYTFKDNLSPGMEIITGETVLHNEDDPQVRISTEMKTSDRRVTPVLEELIVEWTASDETTHNYILTTDEDFTSNSTMTQTEFLDTEVVNGTVELGKGSFSAVIDTEGSFRKGSTSVSVRINKDGSIALNIPK